MSQTSIAATLEITPLSPFFQIVFHLLRKSPSVLIVKMKAPKAKLSSVVILAQMRFPYLVTVLVLSVVRQVMKPSLRTRVVKPANSAPREIVQRTRSVPHSVKAPTSMRTRTAEPHEVTSKRFMERQSKSSQRESKKIKLEAFLATDEGQHMMRVATSGQSEAPGEESDSSSDDNDVMDRALRRAGKGRVIARRGRARVRRALQFMSEVKPQVQKIWDWTPSYLEMASIDRGSLAQYLVSLGVLSACGMRSTLDPTMADLMMVTFMNESFLKGLRPWVGEKAMAALLLFAPSLVTGKSVTMPRCLRVLKGWRKLSPSSSKQARPYAVWCALCVRLVHFGLWKMAVAIMIQLVLYLRVAELYSVRCGDLLRPSVQGLRCWALSLHPATREKLSKTGLKDENVTFATRLSIPLQRVLVYLAEQAADQPILDVPYPEFLAQFKRAAQAIGVPQMVPSEARHSGASIEIGLKMRTTEEGQKQGRWASLKNLRRYEKAGELNKEWQKYSDRQQRHFLRCEKGLVQALLVGTMPDEMPTFNIQGSAASQTPAASSAAGNTVGVRSATEPTSSSRVRG